MLLYFGADSNPAHRSQINLAGSYALRLLNGVPGGEGPQRKSMGGGMKKKADRHRGAHGGTVAAAAAAPAAATGRGGTSSSCACCCVRNPITILPPSFRFMPSRTE